MIPTNEMGVIVELARREADSGFKILSIQAAFPDAVVEHGGQQYRVEFEYKASNFRAHQHDVRAVDLVICWENDADCILPVLALSEPDWAETDLSLPAKIEREAAYWKRRALLLELRVAAAEQRARPVLAETQNDTSGVTIEDWRKYVAGLESPPTRNAALLAMIEVGLDATTKASRDKVGRWWRETYQKENE